MIALPAVSSFPAADVSGELAAALDALSEITTPEGRTKFDRRNARLVAVAICCRSYASAVHELCHLVVIARAAGRDRGWEDVFWNTGPATAATFRHVAQRLPRGPGSTGADFEVTRRAVMVRYRDGTFSIAYSRMPFLSALLELLLSTLGYVTLDRAFEKMAATVISSDSVSAAAKDLSRSLYAYLGQHLPSAQQQRNFRSLIAFLEDRVGRPVAARDIDDAAVLDFWRHAEESGSDGSSGFRTFSFVFRTFVRLYQALDAAGAKAALDRPLPIGGDRAAGEVDPDRIFEMVETIDEKRNALEALRDGPAARVKFLNGREVRELELLFDAGRCAFELPLSLMRAEVFGQAQLRLTQASRRRGVAAVGALLTESACRTYAERHIAFHKSYAQVMRVLLASLHVLANARHQTAVALVLALRPDADYAQLATLFPECADEDGNVVVLETALVRRRFFDGVSQFGGDGDGLGEVFRESRSAFRQISRQGFSNADLDDPEIHDGFAAAADALIEVKDTLARFCARLGQAGLPQGTWSRQFDADREIFSAQFERLYGGQP